MRSWLEPNGWIGAHVWNLNEFGKSVFQNSLPTDPEAGLQALEVNLPRHDADTSITTGDYVPRILRSLAWDAALFDRCVALLQVLAIYGDDGIAKEASDIHTSLFHLYLSGTHATSDQRLAVARRLLNSADSRERALGISALRAMLQSMYFGSGYDFQFGARSRDFGYQPKTYDDQSHWYRAALALAEEIAQSNGASASAAKAAISANFRGLWTVAGLRDELEGISARFAAQAFWRDVWLAVKQTRYLDAKDKSSDNYSRLSKLEGALRPRDLVQNVRGRIIGSKGGIYDFDDVILESAAGYRLSIERKNDEAIALGTEVAADEGALEELLPDIVGSPGSLLWYFGMGLARAAKNPKALWYRMVEQLANTDTESRNLGAFCGILFELNVAKSELSEELLDDALENEPLALYFPTLQASVVLNRRGMARLSRSLSLGKVPTSAYGQLHLGRAIEVVPGADIANFILKLAEAPNGESIAVHAFSMQFYSDRQSRRPHAPEIVGAGRKLLHTMEFKRQSGIESYELNEVVQVCVSGLEGRDVAKTVCDNLKRSTAEHKTYGFDHDQLLRVLLKMQPLATLDALLTGDEKAVLAGRNLLEQAVRLDANPMDDLDEAAVFEWCAVDPSVRFPLIASTVSAFLFSNAKNTREWRPIASRLVHSAPDPIAVMQELAKRLRPIIWGGSRSTILAANADLLDQFDTQGNVALGAHIETEKEKLQSEARADLQWETKFDKEQDERFE